MCIATNQCGLVVTFANGHAESCLGLVLISLICVNRSVVTVTCKTDDL